MASTKTLSLLQRGAGDVFRQSLSSPYHSGAVAVGIAKLLQHVLAELLTRRGTVRFDPRYGCDLVDQIGITNVSSLSDMEHVLHVALSDITGNMRSRMIGHEPLDETLDRIAMERLQQEHDRVIAVLRIYSRAGETVSYDLVIKLNTS